MKKIYLILLMAVFAFGVTACGGSTSPASAPESASAAQGSTDEDQSSEISEVTFWHSMGGAAGEGIKKMVADFNAANTDIKVVEQYQGTYDDAITKLKSSVSSGLGPDIMQLYDIGTRWMIDSGYAVEMQTVMERNGFDVSQIEPNIAAYYSIGGRLNSMPFNSSTPLMYYNKDAFAAAGLDPENPPKTFDELEAAATVLTEDGKPGMAIYVYGWFFEQYASKQAMPFANNGNGREDKATAVAFDSNGAGLAFFERMDDFNKKGINANFGRDEETAHNAFGTGQTFITFGSTASLPSIVSAINGEFELGTAFLPEITEGANGGVSVGGGSLWMMDKGTDATKDAAWKFIEYAVTPEVQVYWHKQTGYFPITVKAYDLQEMKDQLVQSPQFVTAIDQLHSSNPGAAGALLGVFTEARATVEANWEEMLAGTITAQEAVDNSAATINAAIEQYNIANE